MHIFTRTIEKRLRESLFKGKVVVLYGARQVGKTTLVKHIADSIQDSVYFTCDDPGVRSALSDKTVTELLEFIGNHKLVILDEAQQVSNIGSTLKLLVDAHPEIQVIATGSSSFELANSVVEPLTGRKYEFQLHPISVEEVLDGTVPRHEWGRHVPHRLIYGMYPEIVRSAEGDRDVLLRDIAHSYAYKDILSFGKIRNPEALEKLLIALALQIGSEVSYSELGRTVGIDKETVRDYIRMLEQAFIIFRVRPYHKNSRIELRKLRKVYFYDLGLRNALINNLNPLELRTDTGGLWENFLFVERYKYLTNKGLHPDMFFWRTSQKQEIDYLEQSEGGLQAFEFKWKKKSMHIPKEFSKHYPDTSVTLINLENHLDFVTDVGDIS